MAAYDLTIVSSYGQIVLNGSKNADDGTENHVGYQPPLDFLGMTTLRNTTTDKMGADGGFFVVTDQNLSARQPSIDAWIIGKTQEDTANLAQQFRNALPIREHVMLYIETESGQKYGIKCGVLGVKQQIQLAGNDKSVIDYTIDLYCEDPFWQDYTSATANTVNIVKQAPGGLRWTTTGLRWTTTGLRWLAGSPNPTVLISGNQQVFPQITIVDIVHNPVLTNITTGQVVSLDLSTNTGDVVIIDMDAETVTLNGANIINNVNQSDFWGLMPGSNTVSYQSDNSTDNATVTASWRDLYSEVI